MVRKDLERKDRQSAIKLCVRLVSYAYVSLKKNDVQELRSIWDNWQSDKKWRFNQLYGDIALLLHVKIDEPLIRALKDRVDKLEKEHKKICFELEDLRKGYQEQVQSNSNLKRSSEYWKKTFVRQPTSEQAFEDPETISELQIVLFDRGFQWRFCWEQTQQRVKARDAIIRDFLEQVQKIVANLSGLHQASVSGAGSSDGVAMSPTPHVVISLGIVPGLQGDSSAVKTKALSAVKMVKAVIIAPHLDTTKSRDGSNCCYHNEEGHEVQDCPEFKDLIQLMMDKKEQEFYEEV
ncbi:hypothetical protein F3Y22_tig00110387pilonHSYRG00581 [Hibiscus syriacus]|uniref:Uncharacterized protein n=1 Tax=Hibiscus syriacus TaxID=106335 RepID=A0A6A3AV96_HIBSY|nr:hypothetical protein F3Y22_tig00110387pilonHSYRG00581 [Hibiscus syriacus]